MDNFSPVKSKPSMNKLVRFHTFHKYLFMAFDPNELNNLGSIVANHENLILKEVICKYSENLKIILGKLPTRKKHANVLRRMYGRMYKKLPRYKQEIIETQISNYQSGKIKLNDVLENLRVLTIEIDNLYVAKQSYFLLFSEKKVTRFL